MVKREIIKILTFLLMCLALPPSSLYANTKVLVNPTSSPTKAIDTVYQIAKDHLEAEEAERSLEYLQQALDLSLNSSDKYLYFEILVSIGRAYFLNNNYTLSQEYLFKFIHESDNSCKQSLKSDAYALIASNYNVLGDISAAHDYRLKAIEIDEILRDTQSIASNYYNLGSLYFYQDVFEKALEYYKKANEIGRQIHNSRIIYNSTAAMGSVYGKLGKIELALELNYKSLEIADSLNYMTGQAYSLGNLGSNYIELNEYTQATKYVERSLTLKEKLNDKWGQIGAHLTLNKLHAKTNKFKEAEKNLFAALEIAQGINAKKRIADVYKDISNFYLETNKTDLAFEYLNKHIEVKDSLMNEDVLREMSDQKSEFELQKKEYEIGLLKKDNEILETNKRAQQSKLIAFGLIAVFFLFVSITFRSLLSKQKKLTRLLETKNEEIEIQKDKIQIQNKELESSNEDLQQFAYVASHDLREPLRMITSYGKILNRRYKDTLDENGQEFLHFMTDAAKRMDGLLLDLLDYARTTSSTHPFEQVSTAEIMQILSKITESSFSEKNATLDIRYENLPTIKGRKTQIHQLFQNLITNGLKYNLNEKPHVKIDCIENDNEYVFSFTDNGIGIPDEHQTKIFEMFHRLHAKGEFNGTGIGLATCKKIADLHNGFISVKSKEGLGSSFYFHMPK